MPLPIPAYIADASIESHAVRYAWDEWTSKKSIYGRDTDADLAKRLTGLSQRGRIALTNGVAEWLVYRFRPLLDNTLAFDALEAAWAGVIDRKYVLPLASFRDDDKDDWSGPVRGVIRRGLLFANDVIDLGWTNGSTVRLCVKITNLTRYVLPQTADFESWLSAVIERLASLSPLLTDDFVGEVVPREALDPRREFDPQTTEALIQRFLGTLNPAENPYLASHKTMIDWGFQGEPYTFDIATDRERRRSLNPA